MDLQRRLVAVVFADIAGYTSLMQSDEAAALILLRKYKSTIFAQAPLFEGDIVQYYGDGCLLTFPSASQALQCALSMQLLYRAEGLPVRIGVNQGEVVFEEEHVYGDSVNITSRIESMGLPGTVLFSQSVKENVANQGEFSHKSLGKFAFKHVEQPIEVFALTNEGLVVPRPEQLILKGTAYQIDNTPAKDPSATAPIQVLVVEDDMIVGSHISMVLAEAGYAVLGLIPTGEAALEQIKTFPPDLVLMDVTLKGKLDGVDTAALIYERYRVPVIFLTANADPITFGRAKAAFPYAFISKPFKPIALLQAIELVVQRIQEEQSATTPPVEAPAEAPDTEEIALNQGPKSDHIFVRDKDRMVKVKMSDIRYIEAERNYCRIHTSNRQYLLSSPMKTVESHLDTAEFVRSHRSFVVNVAAIDGLDEHYLYLGDQAIPMSKAYKEEVYQRLNRI